MTRVKNNDKDKKKIERAFNNNNNAREPSTICCSIFLLPILNQNINLFHDKLTFDLDGKKDYERKEKNCFSSI